MSLQEQALLRYRYQDHRGLNFPPSCVEPESGRVRPEAGGPGGDLRGRSLFPQAQLSIRFLDTVCNLANVVRHFHAVLKSLTPRTGAIAAGRAVASRASVNPPAVWQPLQGSSIVRWLRAKFQELGETVMDIGILGKRGLASVGATMGQKPRWITEFINDLVMLYMIKRHWHHILHEWLPRPWTYRYEWGATLYLIYLTVQARLPKPA